MFKQWLMRSGVSAFYAPNTDTGEDFDDDEGPEEILDDEGDQDDPDEGDGDEGEGDDAGAEEGEGEEEAARAGHDVPVRQPSRAERRVQQALKAAKEANEKAAKLERLLTERTAPREPQETPAQRQARLDAMEPEDRINYLVDEKVGGLQRQFATLSFQMQDQGDRTAFDGLCARNPVAAKLRDQVEERLQEMRASGTTAPRETVFYYVLGKRAAENATKAGNKARKAAAANAQRQQGRPGSARGDAAPEGRRGGADTPQARAKRLEGMRI